MPAQKETQRRTGDASDSTKRVNDTLDFYNDSLPRRAVEGLFDKADKPKPAVKEAVKEKPEREESGAGMGPAPGHPTKKAFDDLEDSMSIYASKPRDVRKRTFLDEPQEPEPAVQKLRRPTVNLGIDDEVDTGYSRIGNFFSNIDTDNLPVFKIAVGAVVIIVIFVMTALIFKINSVNARLDEANAKLASVGDESADYQRALIENGGLKDQIAELEEEIEILKEQLSSAATSSGAPSQSTDVNQPSQPNQPNQSVESGEFTMYTVQQGDTLSRIASRFYGNSGEYQKIMDANGLTNTNIYPSQPLKIPPR